MLSLEKNNHKEKPLNLWEQFWSYTIFVRTLCVLGLFIVVKLNTPIAFKTLSCSFLGVSLIISFLPKNWYQEKIGVTSIKDWIMFFTFMGLLHGIGYLIWFFRNSILSISNTFIHHYVNPVTNVVPESYWHSLNVTFLAILCLLIIGRVGLVAKYQWLKNNITPVSISILLLLFTITGWFVAGKVAPTFQIAEQLQTTLLNTKTTNINKEYATAQLEYVKGLFTLIGGLVGILVLMKSFFSHQLDREKTELDSLKAQNERFSKARENLNNDNSVGIRLSGLDELEALVQENPTKFRQRALEAICFYSSIKGRKLQQTGFQNTKKTFEDLRKATRIILSPENNTLSSLNLQNVIWQDLEINDQNKDPKEKNTYLLPYANFSNAYLQNITFKVSSIFLLAFYNFEEAFLDNIDFKSNGENKFNVHLSNWCFKKSTLKNVKFCNIHNSIFEDTSLDSVDLGDVYTTEFVNCIFENKVSFEKISFTLIKNSDLTKVNLKDYAYRSIIYNCTISRKQFETLFRTHHYYQGKLTYILCTVPAKGVDIEHLRNNLDDDSLWEQHPETLTDDEVKQRLKLNVVDDVTPDN
jgi:uncharacterized protein YjbI with pentapeptide repeats